MWEITADHVLTFYQHYFLDLLFNIIDIDIRMIRSRKEENTLDFDSDNGEKYNVAFSKRELIKFIAQATASATCPDVIHCRFLNYLPDCTHGTSCIRLL